MRRIPLLAALAVVGLSAAAYLHAQPEPGQPAPRPQMGLPDLVGPLLASPGCLGVDTALTSSGKHVIFAWFTDKAAVIEWYNSRTHQSLARRFFGPADPDFSPLAGVPDGAGPLMVVASLTLAARSAFEETPLPVSQIAIEIYQPATGGLFLGGRFAPDGVVVKGMIDYTPREDAEDR